MPRTAKLASINPASELAGNECPVAALAAEAAQIVRALYALAPPDSPLFRERVNLPNLMYLFDGDDGPNPEVVQYSLRKRLQAIAQFAQFKKALSVKGALFHLYLAGHEAICIDGDIFVQGEARRQLKDTGRRLEDLLYSAVGNFDDGQDDDLRVLRSWFYPTEDHQESRGDTVLQALDAVAQSCRQA